MRTTLLALAIVLLLTPMARADNHTIDDQGETEGTWELDDLLQWHCKGAHRPIHCGNATYASTSGTLNARSALRDNDDAPPIPVTEDSSLALIVSLDGLAGATADVTMSVEDDSGIAFTTRKLTKTVTAGTPVTFDFPFLLMPNWPRGDLVGPHVVMEVVGEGSAETWIPMVLRPPGDDDRPWSVPLGPWVALGAIVLAALVWSRARRH